MSVDNFFAAELKKKLAKLLFWGILHHVPCRRSVSDYTRTRPHYGHLLRIHKEILYYGIL